MARKGQFKLLQVVIGEDKAVSFVPIKATRPLDSTQDALNYLKDAEVSGKIYIVDVKTSVDVESVVVKKNVVKASGSAAAPKKSKKSKDKEAPVAEAPPAAPADGSDAL
jgi:hypothetical protein